MRNGWITSKEPSREWEIVPKDSPNYRAWILTEKDLDEAFLHSIGIASGDHHGNDQ